MLAGRVVIAIYAFKEAKQMLEFIKKEFPNCVAVGKLMAAEWAKSQGSKLNFSQMDLDNLDRYEDAKVKIIENLKEIDALPVIPKVVTIAVEDSLSAPLSLMWLR